MQLDTIKNILGESSAVTKDKEAYRTKEDHQISFYLGKPGSAMVISGVKRVTLQKEYLTIEAKNHMTYWVGYEDIHAISDKQDTHKPSVHSSVGFG